MAKKNTAQVHSFVKGMKRDLVNNQEDEKSYFFGLNGRLYSNNGTLSFSSIEGTKDVFDDNRIVSYLGYTSFKDELILMVKVRNVGDFGINPDDEFEGTETYPPSGGYQPIDPAAVDFSDLYELVDDGYYGPICDMGSGEIVPDDGTLKDAFLSITKDQNGNLVGRYLWLGNMGWVKESKICTVGMHENARFKRIYFTDFTNPFRVVNILNGQISTTSVNQFNVFQQFSLSQPLIRDVVEGGMLKSGVNFYSYRLLSNDGQRTVWSDLSERVLIHPGTTGQDIRGGDVSEDTGKKVRIKIINEQTDIYDKIEVCAIIYEAEGSPTSIKSIGVQDLAIVNEFIHTGNEPGYDLNITLADLTDKNGGWRYCSDLKTKKNKLVASGLRNTPIPHTMLDMEKDFILKAFDSSGSSYSDSFINPNPKVYKFIPKSGSIGSYRKIKTYIRKIKTFGSFSFTLKEGVIENTINFNRPMVYNDMTMDIWNFIDSIKSQYPNFHFSMYNNTIIISTANNIANLDSLQFIFSTNESSIDSESEYEFNSINVSNLIHGFQSYGFEKGNGIRITFKPEFQELMEKTTPFTIEKGPYHGIGGGGLLSLADPPSEVVNDQYTVNRSNLFNLKPNNFKRGLFKGEVYRLGLQFERAGESLFTIPIGDICVPSLGEDVKGLTIETLLKWSNQRTNGEILESILANLIVDIRLNCELRDIYSSIKLVYVQRTAENRTIVCQGIAAPLVRVNQFTGTSVLLDRNIALKWTLPFMGGPGIDARGVYDTATYGENSTTINNGQERGRTRVSKNMFYLDCPDVLFDRIPDSYIKSAKLRIVGKVMGDHYTRGYIGRYVENGNYRSFSQKIQGVYPIRKRNVNHTYFSFTNGHGLVGNAEILPNWVNVTVFSEFKPVLSDTPKTINKTKMMAKGEILAGSYLDSQYEISNNALALAQPALYYNIWDRYPEVVGGDVNFEGFKSSRHCVGARTLFVKTDDPIFDEAWFEGQIVGSPNEGIGQQIESNAAYKYHAIMNAEKDNLDTIYGGRSELAYSRNVYIPMSKTIAIPKNSNRTIRMKVQGDTYCSLFFNNKTQYAPISAERIHMWHSGGADSNTDFDMVAVRTAAWAYGVVLESTIDIALAKGKKFYQSDGAVDMMKTTENINEVYYQEGTLRKFIPKPIDFVEDPDMLHIVAVSETKLMGDTTDSWTRFKVNNFYELEKNKGAAYNLGKNLDDIFAIQEFQSSKLLLNERSAVNTTEGQVFFKSGDGSGIDGHQVVSDYGTSIRRSVTEIASSVKGSAGFYFYDERKNEIVKVSEGILVKEEVGYYINKMLEGDTVYDVEGYYDDLNKETIVRTRSQKGKLYTYSYNELFGVMNGFYELDNDQYFNWNNEIFAPKPNSTKIEQINKGIHLQINGSNKSLKIGVVCNINPTYTKIFHNFMANINTMYPIENLTIKTSSGQERIIPGTHSRYRIREGIHSVPLKNEVDWEDLRGEWMELTLEIRNKENKKIDIFSITNFVRQSYL